jgi:hypothetical protein
MGEVRSRPWLQIPPRGAQRGAGIPTASEPASGPATAPTRDSPGQCTLPTVLALTDCLSGCLREENDRLRERLAWAHGELPAARLGGTTGQ